MKIWKVKVFWIFWIFLDYFSLNFWGAEGETLYSCGASLSLTCDSDSVVTADVSVVAPATDVNCENCICVVSQSDCTLDTMSLLKVTLLGCLWRASDCLITLPESSLWLTDQTATNNPACPKVFFTTPSRVILATNFRCVTESTIYDICDFHRITSSSGYVTSPGFPSSYGARHNCTLSIDVPSAMSVRLRIISSHMPNSPCREKDNLFLYTSDFRRLLCGEDLENMSSSSGLSIPGGSVMLRFQSRDRAMLYQGFVLHFTVVESVSDYNLSTTVTEKLWSTQENTTFNQQNYTTTDTDRDVPGSGCCDLKTLIGIILGVMKVLLIVVILLACCLVRKRRNNQEGFLKIPENRGI